MSAARVKFVKKPSVQFWRAARAGLLVVAAHVSATTSSIERQLDIVTPGGGVEMGAGGVGLLTLLVLEATE